MDTRWNAASLVTSISCTAALTPDTAATTGAAAEVGADTLRSTSAPMLVTTEVGAMLVNNVLPAAAPPAPAAGGAAMAAKRWCIMGGEATEMGELAPPSGGDVTSEEEVGEMTTASMGGPLGVVRCGSGAMAGRLPASAFATEVDKLVTSVVLSTHGIPTGEPSATLAAAPAEPAAAPPMGIAEYESPPSMDLLDVTLPASPSMRDSDTERRRMRVARTTASVSAFARSSSRMAARVS